MNNNNTNQCCHAVPPPGIGLRLRANRCCPRSEQFRPYHMGRRLCVHVGVASRGLGASCQQQYTEGRGVNVFYWQADDEITGGYRSAASETGRAMAKKKSIGAGSARTLAGRGRLALGEAGQSGLADDDWYSSCWANRTAEPDGGENARE